MRPLIPTIIRTALVPLLFRYPPVGLQPERLAIYLNALMTRVNLEGSVAEVGCHLGGTTVVAATMLRRLGRRSGYICYDTFGGFVSQQFEADVARGTPPKHRSMFSRNSARLVRRILDYHECSEVKLVPGDISAIPDDKLEDAYSVVLIDIDLSLPTTDALKRFWPRLVNGGIILVDDCPDGSIWKARLGYAAFCAQAGLPEKYLYGLGILEKPA